LVTNGGPDFTTTTGWTAGNGTVAVVDGNLVVTSSGSGTVNLTISFENANGRTYAASAVASGGAVTLNTYRVAAFTNFMFNIPTNGTTVYGVSTDTDTTAAATLFWTAGAAGETRTLESITIRELPGYHAVQPTAAARPILARVPASGRRNLLTRTEEFDNAYWTAGAVNLTSISAGRITPNTTSSQHRYDRTTTIAAAAHTFFIEAKADGYGFLWLRLGSTSAVFNLSTGAVTGSSATSTSAALLDDGYWLVSMSGTAAGNDILRIGVLPTASTADFAGDGTSGVLIRNAQLELGSTATDYQRVGSTYDVTEAGQADNYHLVFDGVDDFMVTPSIDFTGTDEMSVFAGVRKLSDGATAIVAEFSVSSTTQDGSFAVLGAETSVNTLYDFRSRGTSRQIAATTASKFDAPTSNVFSGFSDISAPSVVLRLDGVQEGINTDSQGTGNYGNYPLYIGSRAGTSLRFNGHIYSLIVRGALTEANLLNQTETYVASKTAGVDLT
jgi:hypothetical protein